MSLSYQSIEAEILEALLKELKKTSIVTLGGKGGAYEYLEQKIKTLTDSSSTKE